MTPIDYYQAELQKQGMLADEQQLAVLTHLQTIHAALIHENQARQRFLARFRQPKLVKGLYVWGGVGIGKTFLMDCFFHTLPFKQKLRMHFHGFMRLVHESLKRHQGEKNPLQHIAKDLAQRAQVLCFDEFFVSDIVDAMVLARLLQALFAQGVCLVTTSNMPPDNLYPRGLQREQFLPAIDLLKRHTKVWHLASQVDYRLRHMREAGVYFTPHNAVAEQHMDLIFAQLTTDKTIINQPVTICDRQINIIKRAGKVIWFEFQELCRPPRSQHDYLVIAEQYHTVFISHIPQIAPQETDKAILLMRLIDIFYDAKVRVVISATTGVDELYREGCLLFEYQRICSRLKEMQSEAYFSLAL